MRNFFLIYFFVVTFILLFFGVYENKTTLKIFIKKIIKKEKAIDIKTNSLIKNNNSINQENNIVDPDHYWSDQIRKGGYVIFLRHTKRNRFGNVRAFDGLELTQNLRGEQTYFAERVCLNSHGKNDAKMIGDYFRLHNIKASFVVTSKSCRARQTAQLIFNRIDEENNLFIFLSIFKQNNAAMFDDYREKKIEPSIIKYLTSLQKEDGENIFVVAHGGILHPTLFDNKVLQEDLEMDEGGFVVIENMKNKLFFRHKFNKFEVFSSTLNNHKLD